MSTKAKVGIILDLDDTLIGTSRAYYKALLAAMNYTLKVVDPFMVEPELMVSTYYKVHQEQVQRKRNGETKGLYPLSGAKEIESTDFPAILCEAFTVWCTESGYRPTEEDLEYVYRMGMGILTYNYSFLPHAKNLINMLARKPDTALFLVTRGHAKLQGPKLVRPEFDRFERILIVPFTDSKLHQFKKLQVEYDNIEQWYVIGDDINSDINPALACRMRAILVTKAACHLSEGKVIDLADSLDYFYEVYDLQEAVELMREFYKSNHERIYSEVQV